MKLEKPKRSKFAMVSCLCSSLTLLLLGGLALCWLLLDRGPLLFLYYILWYPAVFMCSLALFLAITAALVINRKKRKIGGVGLVRVSFSLILLNALILLIFFILIIPIERIELCAIDLRNLSEVMWTYAVDNNYKWPNGQEWCDVLQNKIPEDHRVWFKCRGDKVGPCSYALNRHAENMDVKIRTNIVLLFESKPGWNQVGGQELLSTNNHNGKGCSIVFWNGRVEFVQTNELENLRWKISRNENDRDTSE